LLIKTMGDLLPQEIYLRPKMGFTFPWENWLKDKIRPQIEEVILGSDTNNEMNLNMESCQNLWKIFLKKGSSISWSRVWAIYVLLKWYDENYKG
ncbi:MAG: hypothetical protein JW787_17295, partial [Sedimentisphaerales bacterium]|nr:hypothetical protein [Sedimentisphaerales bacterium]